MNIKSVHPEFDIPASTTDYQVRISDELEEPDWDAFLEKTPGGHHVQTSLWAQVKALLGWRALRILVTQGEQIIAGAQLLMRPLPLAGVVAHIPKGPVFASNEPVLAEIIIKELHQVAKTYRIQYLIVQPPNNGQDMARRLPGLGFRPSPIRAAPTATVLIDLTNDLDDILSRINKATRRHIRRGLREGIIVREGTYSDLDTFYSLLTATSQRCQFSPEPREYFRQMWRIFRPHGYVRLFLAEHEGEAISAHWVIVFGNTLISKKSGWSGRHTRRRPNEVLEWEVIKWAKAQNYHYYDFEGIKPEAARAILQGGSLPKSFSQTATSFKLKFSGQVTLFPETYDYVYNPLLRWAYSKIFSKVANWPVMKKVIKRLHTH